MAARRIVQHVCQEQLGSMQRPPAGEIDFVASFIEKGAGLLQKAWQRVLGKDRIKISVGGVFCHQTPMVDIKGSPPYRVPTRRCELADLLILQSHLKSDGKIFWRGVLIQAKAHSSRI